VSLTEKD